MRVAVVTFESGPPVAAYIRETGTHWPVLTDGSLELYRAYGMGTGRWWNIWGLRTLAAYLKLLLGGRRLKAPTADVNQLGGDVLIDPVGIVQLHHIGKGPGDRPSINELIELVERAKT